ncbi:uncharacterized protein [Salminus brasiliensis]|uniref:uncharacterized protein isoform X2 n=1 Tax=Salminus brasiliensis TaxID=930266 RepID=UPI003B82F920
MENYKRFKDEKYKNWLKAAESLYILRNSLRDFVEKETETYHRSLLKTLQGEICNKKCEFKKKITLCEACQRWKKAILRSRPGGAMGVYWDNCQPSLWPTEKWEVAKIVKIRNTVMHSPDLKLSKEERKNGVDNILQLAKRIGQEELHKTVCDAIEKSNTVLENYLGQDSQTEGKAENIQLLDREQQALKEKIVFLAQRYEADQHEDIKGEVLGMKHFLDQNKDLLENLRPQVNQLDEIQKRVNDHEIKIDQLEVRVDDLEKATLDPMFTNDTLTFKNHLIEQSRKRKWPDPVFTEELEATGFRGRVVVNGRTFEGSQVCKGKRTAHQEVAQIALKSLKYEFEITEESSTSSTMTSSDLFYGTVTVVLDKFVISDGFVKEKEAIESAYSKLAHLLGLKDDQGDNTSRTSVLAHLNQCRVQPPQEFPYQQDDKIFCKLHLKDRLTFDDDDGSTTKKKAEQQAANVALQKLSAFLNCSPLAVPKNNYKGFLKERLEALGMVSPEYKTEQEKTTEELEGPSTSKDHSNSCRDESNENLQVCSSIKSAPQEVANIFKADVESIEEPLTSAAIPSGATSTSSSINLFYGTVTVVISKEIFSDGFAKEEEAIESAYKKLASLFGLGDTTSRTAVLAHFDKCHVKPPQEVPFPQDNKIFCKLQLKEAFPFNDKDGSTSKKKAEQQVAKVALQKLSAFFNCSPLAVSNENYKGYLKECLEALGMDSPEYKTEQKATEELECPNSNRSSTLTRQHEQENASLQQKDNAAVIQPLLTSHSSCAADPGDSSPSSIPNEAAKDDYAEINSLLTVYHLKPFVTAECLSTDLNFMLTLDIPLEKFTFKNCNDYTSKKEAIRKTYCLLGYALGIFPKDTDESQATMLVKKDFTQKSFNHPKEIVDGNKAPFRCSLEEITYNIIYKGQGSTEDEAKWDALKKALETLPCLFGHSALPMSSSTEETENQINTLLRNAGQKDLIVSQERCQNKVSVTLQFKDYTMMSKKQRTKKENRNLLSKCILGLLGVETDPQSPSLRNCVDDWFKQKGLQQPVFTDTEEAQGCKAKFSVQLSFTHTDWEDSLEAAKMKLVQELEKRFQYLID